ncbi:MAG: hypothetical protein EZS28_001670 [Streblomastix strix]|uniref:Ubiquitin-like domain-containing protein n=1 Tax=Streblomastix strix TaxID=222440 RepID=A0A5J4X7H1_9EUKA|nr:MAG: hypothetical protein EZS28_001670 [Streblomastix strix]
MATGADEATQGYRRANLLLYRTGALNPRIFVQHFKNQNYYPMVIFQRQSDSIIARFQDNLAAVNNLLGFHYIQLSEVARDKAFNKILVDTNQNQISIPQNMSQQQLQSISSSSQSIQGEIDIDILQSEILGVMKFFPIYLIHFVACNSHRYVDFFRGSFKHAFEFLKRWPCDSEAAAYYGNQILPLISMFGDKVFTAKNSLILKTQFEGEITVEEYEITFDEEPGVVLHFQKSSNISAETLKVDFIDKVINIKKEKLMKLGLKSTKGQQFKIEISQNSTIVQLKNKMEKELAFPAEQLTLVFVGKVLTNEQTLSQCGIFENATVVFFTKKQTLKLKNEQNQTRPIPQAIPSLESPTQTDAIHPNISNTTPIHTNIQQQRNGVLNPLIQQLNTHPQWDQFRQTILSDPSQFHFIIQQLAKTQPQLVQAIVENPDEFLDVFINGSDSSDSDNIPLNQLIGNPTEQTDSNHESSAASQQNMQQNQQEIIAKLSEEDKQKVTQICDMTGQSMSAAVQVYLACNKSVEEALSFLFNQ